MLWYLYSWVISGLYTLQDFLHPPRKSTNEEVIRIKIQYNRKLRR